ncbi:Uncharacterized protein conserved in archaea [Geoglobus ahangari]|uniref:Uncharacterized protein conserved in archaea n=1 Tax=Geoglobus ahangari TaxID=113653 RepID=A0A0F7IE26_9EURY|nr:nucleoside recognition domain-containing protein [Geoglobus ahangari]AKG91739.1 Uncharacterized protein conserved in archaea [Geoglobus ahangari]
MDLNIDAAVMSTARFLIHTLPVVAAASIATSLMIRKGIMSRISRAARPVLRRLSLSEVTATSVAVCFVSATASYSMLAQAHRDGIVDEREVIAASFVNSFPSAISHTYRFFIPYVIPVLGWTGVIYTSLRMLVAVVKSAMGVAMARAWRTEISEEPEAIEPVLHSSGSLLWRVALIMAVTYFLVQIASQLGVFRVVSDLLSFLPVSSSVIAVTATEMISTKAAIAMGAGMLESGEISAKWLLIALMLGNVITLSTSYVKHSLPFHVSLFGRLGVKIVALNALASLVLDIIVIAGVIAFL